MEQCYDTYKTSNNKFTFRICSQTFISNDYAKAWCFSEKLHGVILIIIDQKFCLFPRRQTLLQRCIVVVP